MSAFAQLLESSYFELFGLAEDYGLDTDDLDARYARLREQAHPDRHVGLAAQQVAAEQLAARVNEAYRILADPMLRAAYLLSRAGQDPFAEHDNRMPADFLEKQMHMREQLEDAGSDPQAIATLQQQAQDEITQAYAQLQEAFSSAPVQLDNAVELVRQIKYLRNFAAECKAAS